ncbi:PKD domain-containing protein [Mesorhizobium sp. L-8-3]|uniref:PKD domain-containing protein n=1 Tax=Mesorhizobium sp. L-8-3 TaxID=2744522 RepID=UPI001926FDE8|nr:PKD domain-containing protein [Mesorhizobium sp. L-8-3]
MRRHRRNLWVRTGRLLGLAGPGMASVVVPAFIGANLDAIRATLPGIGAFAEVVAPSPSDVGLVTFGPMARVNEGDHDFRQVVRIALPEAAGTVHVRVYDPDAAGTYDEPKAGFDTTTRFSLFGDGATAHLSRDAAGVVQESIDGKPLATAEFGADPALDGRWTTLFSVDAAKGSRTAAGAREFLLLVEGLTGNDGNVFDVAVSRTEDANQPPEGLKLSSFLPTFQMPRGNRQAELGFDVPADAESLAIENFDAAAGSVAFAGRFRSHPLAASAKSQWRHDDVALDGDDTGQRASVTATGGSETPNDITVFVGARKSGADAVEQPLAIDLPIRAIAPNRRPVTELAVTQLACGRMRFDASASRDPDGGPLTHRWRFDASDEISGATIEQDFAETGMHAGRLESFDASGVIGDGSARDFTFLVKPPPTASFEAPDLVAEGAALVLDGTGSKAPTLPEGTAIVRYHWTMGDGTELVQAPGDPDFGRPNHRYAGHGAYTVTLTVTDGTDNPCNSATVTRTVTVNAPPVANAGGSRSLALDDTLDLDAGQPTDPDGDSIRYLWDFGDGTTAEGAKASHRFERPGTFAVTLTADDGKGAENSVATDHATIIVNAAPVGDAVATPDKLVVGAPGLFDAARAIDPDGRITRFQWSFGDGTRSDRATVRHSFAMPGTYDVILTLTDDSGLANGTSVIARKVVAVEAGNETPLADAGGDRKAVVGDVLVFDGSASRDPDGSILSYRWDFGDGASAAGIGATHVYRAAGTYRVTLAVADDSGKPNAEASTSFDIAVTNKDNSPPEVRVGGDRSAFVDEIVDFDATGTVDSDGSIVSVHWDFGDGARASGFRARHAYRAPGRYKVHVLVGDDSGRRGATNEATFTVNVTDRYNKAPDSDIPAEIAMEAGVPRVFDATAAVDPDGRITSYNWDFGDGTQTGEPLIEHSYAAPGTYFGKLTLVDDSGLENGITTKRFVAFVEERHNIKPVAAAGADVSAIVGQRIDFDGGASADSDGSLIAYHWDFGTGKTADGERRSIAYFAPGRYEVKLTVTDNSGQDNATASDTLVVTVADRPNTAPVAAVEADRPAAIDEPVAFSGAASRDPDGNILTHAWDFGDGSTAEGREVVHSYARSGAYTARLTVTDDSGLANSQATAERRIKVNEPPVARAGEDQYVTASVVEFDASASSDEDGSIARFEWDFGDGETGTGARIAHTYSSPGAYEARLTVSDDSGTIRNAAQDTVAIRINAMPVADAGFDRVVTPGESVTLDGRRSTDPDGRIARYHWDFRDGATAEGDVVTHAFAKPGRYTVELTVADDSGHPEATDFSQIVVTVNQPPVADAGPDLSVAPGQKFMLSGSGSRDADGAISDWRWDVRGTDKVLQGARPEMRFEQPGIHTVTLTVTDDSSASNRTAQDDVTVAVNHAPAAEAGHDIFSETLRVVLDGSASTDADNDGLAYRWDFGDGGSGAGAVVEHTYETGGIYPVRLTVDDGRGLANSRDIDAITVRINRPPVAQAGDDKQACIGDVVVFDGSASTDPDNGLLRYGWDFADGETADIVNPTKVFAAPGSYRVRLKVTDESGLANDSGADEALVSILPAPVARAGDDMKVCANTIVRFDGTRSTDIDGVVNRYSWDFGDGQAGGGDQPEHMYSDPGTYRVTLQIEGDNLGLCSPVSTDDLIIDVIDAPKPAISAPKAAATNQEVTFDGTGSSIGSRIALRYEWDFGDGSTGTGAIARHAYAQPGTYRALLRAVAPAEAGGCASAQAVHVITVNAAPNADPGPGRSVEVGQSLLLSGARSSDPDGGIADYRWDFGDGGSAAGIEVRHIWRTAGRYRVMLVVSDGTGLPNGTDEKSVEIEVTDKPKVEISAASVACVGQEVRFGLSALSAGGETGPLAWNFGDGATGSGESIGHAYARPGTFTVGVSGPMNRAGNVLSTPIARTIRVNQPPVAIIDAERKACPGTVVSFDGSGSFDPDGTLTGLAWDFGDGSTAAGAKVSHSFSQPGTYPVRLTVTDDSGAACATGVAMLDLFVDAPPVADAGPDAEVQIGGARDSYVLDASRSRDADGDALSHHWVLSNGVELDGEKVRLEFAEPGMVTAKLTTTDPHGLACSAATAGVRIDVRLREQSVRLAD